MWERRVSGRKESLFCLLASSLVPPPASPFPVALKTHPASVTSTDRLQTAVFFPLLGSFSNQWLFRHTVPLQEDAECSLPSGKQRQPWSPSVCWGFTMSCESLEWGCWPGASAAISRESCKNVRAWEKISTSLAWALRPNLQQTAMNSPREDGAIVVSRVSTAFAWVNIGAHAPGRCEPRKFVWATWGFFKLRHLHGNC